MTVSRVYEFAKAHNMSSKAVLELAKKNGIEFNSHMSSMTEGQTQELERLLRQPNAAPAEKLRKSQNKTSQRLRLSLKLSKVTNQPITRRKIKATKVTSKLRSHMPKSLLNTTKAKPRLSLKATVTMANSLTTKINVTTKQTLMVIVGLAVAAVRTVAVTTVKMPTLLNPKGLQRVSIRSCQRS